MSGEYEKIYGCSTEKIARITMCGGCAEWWNYLIVFKGDETDEYMNIYMESCIGKVRLDSKENNKYLVYHIDEEEVKLVDKDYELHLDEDGDATELLIGYDFFNWEQ